MARSEKCKKTKAKILTSKASRQSEDARLHLGCRRAHLCLLGPEGVPQPLMFMGLMELMGLRVRLRKLPHVGTMGAFCQISEKSAWNPCCLGASRRLSPQDGVLLSDLAGGGAQQDGSITIVVSPGAQWAGLRGRERPQLQHTGPLPAAKLHRELSPWSASGLHVGCYDPLGPLGLKFHLLMQIPIFELGKSALRLAGQEIHQ